MAFAEVVSHETRLFSLPLLLFDKDDDEVLLLVPLVLLLLTASTELETRVYAVTRANPVTNTRASKLNVFIFSFICIYTRF